MAISWLTALKVVPWEKVLEHAPGVLDKARGFIDKRRQTTAAPPTELAQLVLAQQQMAQALAELAVVQAKNADLADQFLRAKAEVENARRRAEEEISKARKFAVEAFAESLLPVADSLTAGLAIADATTDTVL